jgi:hypothetical protein
MAQAEDLPICMLCFQQVFHLSQLYCFECWHSVAADQQQKLQDRAGGIYIYIRGGGCMYVYIYRYRQTLFKGLISEPIN